MTKKELKKMFSTPDWSIETVEEADKIISKIATEFLKLETYPNQFEIVTAEQMLDAYSLIGLPLSYNHWKFGKDFVINQNKYKRGQMGLAYELVINSNPCISYNMEENTTCLMLLVLAHANYGHNHFFKNNYMFKLWTQADSIIDYLVFAKDFIHKCEERYGYEEVEATLDACHALMNYGVDKYKKPRKLSPKEENDRLQKKIEDDRVNYSDIWRTLPDSKKNDNNKKKERYPEQPEENILYFIEKNSPALKGWQREIVRIVRKISQYFYPQGQTKVLNEGCASFVHYHIMNKMFDEGYLDEGVMLEFFHHHSNVLFQPPFDAKYYSGINPYTLGFNILQDIKRICENPTEEDIKWFPNLIGKSWLDEVHFAINNFKDESFILQYLSPKVIRDMRLFMVSDEQDNEEFYTVSAIHNETGYKKVREALSAHYSRSRYVPDIQVFDVDIYGSRSLTLEYIPTDNKDLNMKEVDKVLPYIKYLWGFPIHIFKRQQNGKRLIIATKD